MLAHFRNTRIFDLISSDECLFGVLESLSAVTELVLAKHFAFTRCGELNLNGMVEAQIAVFESELLAGSTLVS